MLKPCVVRECSLLDVNVNDFVESHVENVIESRVVRKERRKLRDGGWVFISLEINFGVRNTSIGDLE